MHPTSSKKASSTRHPASDKKSTQHPTSSNKQKSMKQKITALLLTFTVLLPSISPYNNLWANNNGPTAPEATSFEPVDATDMVNLVTGNMSYVLPLLTIPSPEGGYPLALAYHAGIAMDQEASWVGLGWNLNPGAINRSVSGYPDDWGKTSVSEFYYDKGGEQEFYNFSIGGILPNGVTLGLSAAWGDFNAWGGIVGYGGLTANFGSEGLGIGASYGGISANIGTQGFGVNAGYGPFSGGINYQKGNGTTVNVQAGTGLGNNSQIGGGFSFNSKSNELNGSIKGSISYGGVGVSLSSSKGLSFSSPKSPISSSSSSSTITSGDYYIIEKDNGFNFDVGFFWASYRHQFFSYSLFKETNLSVSGALNLYDNIKNDDGTYERSSISKMDIKQYYSDSYGDTSSYDIFTKKERLSLGKYRRYRELLNKMAFPNFDHYSISGQGVSGVISPELFEELNLYSNDELTYWTSIYDSDRETLEDKVEYYTKLGGKNLNNYKLGGKINFNIKNNSGFYRNHKGNFIHPEDNDIALDSYRKEYFRRNPNGRILSDPGYRKLINNTENENKIVNDFSQENNTIYNNSNQNKLVNERRKAGNFIEVFTNKDILEGNTNGWFLESKDFDRTNNLYPEASIGGYRVTTIDGKTYHYSQPVYHFESFFKNFNADASDEYAQFFESKKTEPYATHWLLTAVTGPDYVDVNSNNILDNDDFGYWVDFEYGKWSDAYAWRSPKTGFQEVRDNNNYFWGVKQIYYLDKIKTRTHTALFLKSERFDDKGISFSHYNKKYRGNGSIHSDQYTKILTSKRNENAGGVFYELTGEKSSKSEIALVKKQDFKYIDIPEETSLELSKVIILKNEHVTNVNKYKAPGDVVNDKVAYSYYNSGYISSNPFFRFNLLNSPPKLNVYKQSLHKNVLTETDVDYNKLKRKALKIIDFEYRSVGSGLPNSGTGRGGHLSLHKIHVLGKQGETIMPPYQFDYLHKNIKYDHDNQDVWGYIKDTPEAWSLSEIKTPQGAKINIEYEEDSFYTQAAYNNPTTENIYFWYLSNHVSNRVNKEFVDSYEKGSDYLLLRLDGNIEKDINDYFKKGQSIKISVKRIKGDENSESIKYWTPRIFYNQIESYIVDYMVEEVDNVNKTLKLSTTELTTNHEAIPEVSCIVSNENDRIYGRGNENFCTASILFNFTTDFYTIDDKNGRKGGGLRVTKVNISDNINEFTTEYDYRNPDDKTISGITTYVPSKSSNEKVSYIEEIPAPNVMYEYVTVSNKDSENKLLGKTLYSFNTVKPFDFSRNIRRSNNVVFSMGESFNVVTEYDLTKAIYIYGEKLLIGNEPVYLNKHTIHDNTAILGTLNFVKTYNNENHLLSCSVNNYKKYNIEEDHSQGITQETYKTLKKYKEHYRDTDPITTASRLATRNSYHINASSKVTYPNVLESSTTLQNGIETKTTNDRFDFLTGQALETTVTSNSITGSTFKTEVKPAYTFYKGMGSKIDDIHNKNMLSQPAETLSFYQNTNVGAIIDYDFKLYNAEINTWKPYLYGVKESRFKAIIISDGPNQGQTTTTTEVVYDSIWRKHKNYVWKGALSDDGSFKNFTYFDWNKERNSEAQHTSWQKLSEITKYSDYSRPLETEDINGNKASNKMGDNYTKVWAVCNAPYDAMFYANFENQADFEIPDNDVSGGFATVDAEFISDKAHTGSKALKLKSAGNALYLRPKIAGNYKASVWAHKSNYQNIKLDLLGENASVSFNPNELVEAGDWVQLNFYVTLTQEGFVVLKSTSGDAYIDDFRMHPIESNMTSYVYNEWDELTYILGPNNLATYFVYDAAGRLIKTYNEIAKNGTTNGGFKLVGENKTYYKGQTAPETPIVADIYINEKRYFINDAVEFLINAKTKDPLGFVAWKATIEKRLPSNFENGVFTGGELEVVKVMEGTGNPPDKITHSFDTTGFKRLVLELTNSEGITKTFIKSLDIDHEVYFEADKLIAPAGSILDYRLVTTGYDYTQGRLSIKTNGNNILNRSVYKRFIATNDNSEEVVTGSFTIPSSGYVDVDLKHILLKTPTPYEGFSELVILQDGQIKARLKKY